MQPRCRVEIRKQSNKLTTKCNSEKSIFNPSIRLSELRRKQNWLSFRDTQCICPMQSVIDECMCVYIIYSNVVRQPSATVVSRWRRGTSYPCNRKTAELSCIVGCYGCATTYGRYVYDMAACCRECQLTQAKIIDVGPEQCSAEFIIAPGERKLLTRRNW